jgi:uncharacterized protein
MKKILILLILMFLSYAIKAQIQIRPLPENGYEQRIKEFVSSMTIVDTHEHLWNPDVIKNGTMLDFVLLFHHYANDDIKSAGMPSQSFQKLLTDSLTVMQKWQAMKPFYEASFNTSYNRVAQLAADKLFGISDINESTVEELSGKIRSAYQGEWFYKVLKEKCKIEYIIQDGEDRSFGNEMFRYVTHFDRYVGINSKNNIFAVGKIGNLTISSIDDLVNALNEAFNSAMEKGFVAVKSTLAYNRILYFEDVKKEKAEEVFNMILAAPDKQYFSFNEVKPLQDYMMHRILDLARTNKVPVQIHTGILAGGGSIIENTNPAHLSNLFLKYRDVKFILFHGGFPFGGELTSIAKTFRNVFIDMCWLYIISPSYSERYLHEWLETVPANKIMAFGGDYHNVENIYGHLLFAKQIISRVLIEKVKDGYLSESEAIKIARMILHDNAIEILNLK